MPRSILTQRQQWDYLRYGDSSGNFIEAPVDTEDVDNPATGQGSDAFSQDATGTDTSGQLHHAPSVMEDATAVQWRDKGSNPSGTPSGGGSSSGGASGASSGGSAGGAAGGGTAVPGSAGSVPLIRKPDGTYTSSDPEWAKLIARESGGNPTIVNTDPSDPNAGPNASQGLFQFTPKTWQGLGYSGQPKDAPADVQAQAAAKLLHQNPSGGDWGAGNPGRENAQLLMKGLSAPSASSSPTAAGGANLGAPAAPPGQLRNVNPSHGQGPIDGPDVHGQLPPDMVNFQNSLKKQFPQIPDSAIGTYRAPDPGGFDEHSSGHGMDVMMPGNPALQKQVKDWALNQPNVNFVLNQQQQFNPDGSSSKMETRNNGNPTDNHYDHDHINVAGDYQPDPSAGPATTPGTPAPTDPTAPPPPIQPMTVARREPPRARTEWGY